MRPQLRPIQSDLSREANLSPKFEAHGARQGRRYGDHLLIWPRLTLAGKSRRVCALKEWRSFRFGKPSRCWFAMPESPDEKSAAITSLPST